MLNEQRCECAGVYKPTGIRETSYEILCCSTCGILRTNPFPHAASFSREYYQKNYLQRLDYWSAKNRLYYENYVAPYCSSGSILDIGAGIGLFLSTLDSRQWQRFGLDPSTAACQIAQETFGLTLTATDTAHFQADTGFDVVTLWDVLPAIEQPYSVLRDVHHLCKPNGIVIAKTPNIDVQTRWVSKALARIKKGSIVFQPHARSSHFSLDSLRYLFEHSGFDVVSAIATPSNELTCEGSQPKSLSTRLKHTVLRTAIKNQSLILVAKRKPTSVTH